MKKTKKTPTNYEKKVEKRDKKNKRCLYVKDQHIFCDKRL